MIEHIHDDAAGGSSRRRLHFYTAGFLRQRRLRRILTLAGYDLTLGRPARRMGPDDLIAVWGRAAYAHRGEAVAEASGASLLRIEDAFLRSLHPGRAGEPPLGLLIDRRGAYFDAAQPSDLEVLLASHPLDDTALLNRARGGIARLREAHLTKYSAVDPEAPLPAPGYVLVIDQTRGDASVTHGGADANTFREMLYYAQEENPGAPVLIKTHPETAQGHRPGYFTDQDASERVTLFSDPVSPWALLEGAVAVYVVTSQLGFEAILAGHRPRVYGQPFYAGWGLTEDRHPLPLRAPRRGRSLTAAQLFAGAMILYPTWYDPARDRLATFEEALGQFEAQVRAWREDRHGWVARGMRLWKRPFLQDFFGGQRRVRFSERAAAPPARTMVWAGKATEGSDAWRLEDGFLRSRGLGAELVPPLSLALDDLGIYYDPTRESRLERMIAARARLRPDQQLRAESLTRALVTRGLTKYNLPGDDAALPEGYRILVPGQVEDDASIRLGAGEVRTNLALLQAARAANPEAVILYRPHPDVTAGLRPGAVPPEEVTALADAEVAQHDMAQLLEAVDEVWTITSLTGFEALLRGRRVTVLGAPFYAGWCLTRDLGPVPERRQAHVTLAGLVHAALIDYPRYRDPVSGLPCAVELALERLAEGAIGRRGPGLRLLAKAQGLLASRASLWR